MAVRGLLSAVPIRFSHAIEHEGTGPGDAYARLTEAREPHIWFQADVTARMPTSDESKQLQLPAASPILAIQRLVWGSTGR